MAITLWWNGQSTKVIVVPLHETILSEPTIYCPQGNQNLSVNLCCDKVSPRLNKHACTRVRSLIAYCPSSFIAHTAREILPSNNACMSQVFLGAWQTWTSRRRGHVPRFKASKGLSPCQVSFCSAPHEVCLLTARILYFLHILKLAII
jgi:hypothetical protein